MTAAFDFKQYLRERRADIEQALDADLPRPPACPPIIADAMRYSVLAGGKRLRPILTLASAEAVLDHDGADPKLREAGLALTMPAACAVELIHTYSLVHDDLPAMDDDDLRRGMPTTHRKYGVATAILAADALQPLAFRMLASHSSMLNQPALQVKIIKTLADACGSKGMTGGQAIDLASEGQQLHAAELENMYRLKTGRLLHASVISAAYCAEDLDDQALKDLERFIDALGLAFQIRDDILDIEGSTEQIGKQSGADDAKQKATYPSLFGLERARVRTDDLLTKALAALDQFGQEANVLREVAKYIVRRER